MRQARSNGYDALAVWVAGKEGLRPATAEACAADGEARGLRDVLWEEYERQLRDAQTYTLDAVWKWLKDHGADVGRNTPWRDRQRLLSRERVTELAAAKARAVIELAGAAGETDTLRGGRIIAGQLLFQTLCDLTPEALDGLEPGQVLRLIKVLGELSKAHAETDLINERLAVIQRQLEEKKATADQAAEKVLKGKDLDDETIDRIRAIYGLPRLQEIAR